MNRTNIYLTGEQLEQLDARARAGGMSRAELVRQVLDRALRGESGRLDEDLAAIDDSFLLRHTDVVDLTDLAARSVGKLLGMSGTSDPVDAHVALIARSRGWPVLTSDPEDLLAIDGSLDLWDV